MLSMWSRHVPFLSVMMAHMNGSFIRTLRVVFMYVKFL